VAVSGTHGKTTTTVMATEVLTAMGADPALARGAVRVSLGWSTTEIEVEQFLGTWIRLSASLLKERRGLAA
jgi:cysteine desulfurase